VDIMNAFHEFHLLQEFEESLNTTFISLIPNGVRAIYIKDIRSISLVSGVHKIIFKVLASRLKTVLEKVISRSINVVIRAGHGSVRAGFGPFGHPTRASRV
jgi:hypothetical protein